MGFRNLLNLATQAQPLSATRGLLEQAVQDDLAQISVNEQDIADIIASKGAANGIATLDASGVLNQAQIPSLAIGNTFASGSVSEMTTSPAADKTGATTPKELGDVVIRTDLGGEAFKLVGNDPTIADNWVSLGKAEDGVTAIDRDGSMLTGAVALAEIAFTGSSNDASYNNSVSGLSATNAKDAIDELAKADADEKATRKQADALLDTKLGDVSNRVTVNEGNVAQLTQDVSTLSDELDTETQERDQADQQLQQQLDGKLTVSNIVKDKLLNGSIDGANTAFVVPESFVNGTLTVYLNQGRLREGDDYTVAGTTVTLMGAPYGQEQVFADYIKAA